MVLRGALLALAPLLLAVSLACAGDAKVGATQESSPPPPAPPAVSKVLAIRTTEPLAALLREGYFFRRLLPGLQGLRVDMGPQAAGDAVVVIETLPASSGTAALVKGLPVEIGGEAVVLDGTRYPGRGFTLAARIPEAEKETWLVVGRTPDEVVSLGNHILLNLSSSLMDFEGGPRRPPLAVDYILQETQDLARNGRWAKREDGTWGIDRATERDDFAAREQALAALARIAGERVVLLVPPGEKDRPEMARLAAELDRAAGEMAPKVPVAVTSPVTVMVETDHVTQGRYTGKIGEAVRGEGADLHLVYHPDDVAAYRHALAGVLLARAGIANRLPPGLARGASLWLSWDWYGKPWPEWLPLLAAARVLPEAEQILAGEEASDASEVLWSPAAAAVVDRLPGSTLAEKLARVPEAGRVGEILKGIEPQTARVRPERKASVPKGFLKGVSFAMAIGLERGYHSPSIARPLAELESLGTNAVSLMPFASQPGPDRPELRFLNDSPGSETDIGLIHATRLSRARGLHVLYKPHIWVRHGSWSGDIEMKTEEDWARWWHVYRRYVLHHAMLARWAGADSFCVGVELSKTIPREKDWRDLIDAVRTFFPGPLTYAANWYGDLEHVAFWDDLDFIGVDAYFPLSSSPQASRAELEKGARQIVDRFAATSRRWGKPILLTEVGFAAHRGAWVSPHEEGGEYSEEDQALAYEVLFDALGRRPWLAGTFVWKAFSSAGTDSGQRADFQFMGRKAEGVVGRYYGGDGSAPAGRPSPPPTP
ncbi:MAG TPA: hypothetical protein VE685_27645, partial [Thermoanaerobaculia bacterium]|nr:hypothetical protein [Thermoanaerobaculia bacterium]